MKTRNIGERLSLEFRIDISKPQVTAFLADIDRIQNEHQDTQDQLRHRISSEIKRQLFHSHVRSKVRGGRRCVIASSATMCASSHFSVPYRQDNRQ